MNLNNMQYEETKKRFTIVIMLYLLVAMIVVAFTASHTEKLKVLNLGAEKSPYQMVNKVLTADYDNVAYEKGFIVKKSVVGTVSVNETDSSAIFDSKPYGIKYGEIILKNSEQIKSIKKLFKDNLNNITSYSYFGNKFTEGTKNYNSFVLVEPEEGSSEMVFRFGIQINQNR